MRRLDRDISRSYTRRGAGKIILNEKLPTVLLCELGKPRPLHYFSMHLHRCVSPRFTSHMRYRALDHASATNAYGINLNGERKEENKLIGHATCSTLFLA